MSKKITFTTISPLPADISRQAVLDFLHSHEGMIDLNPLVVERHPLPTPPPHCPDEERECVWWSMTDKISYMPGVKSDLTYTAAFQDLHDGIRTHCYAPMGTHIRERWSLGGTLPGEPMQPVELGSGAPRQGLYVREDVEVRCNFLMASFVKKTILKAHGVLCAQLVEKARALDMATKATAAPSLPSPMSTAFSDGQSVSSGGRSDSTYGDHRGSYFGGASDVSTLQSRRSSPPAQMHRPQQYHLQHQHQQQNSGGLQPFYGHHTAATSETTLTPEPLRIRRSSGQGGPNQTYTGQGWQAQQQHPYIHDPHSPYATQQQAPQIPPLSGLGNGSLLSPVGRAGSGQSYHHSAPIAELSAGETHIAELQ